MSVRRVWETGWLLLAGVLLVALAAAERAGAAPKKGGDVVFAQEAQVAGLAMHFSSAISTRNIAMHLYVEEIMEAATDGA